MKSLRALKAAGLVLVAVVLGLMTVQGSYALWNTTAPSNAGTIQAADFRVLVNGTPMPAASISNLSLGDMARGSAKYTKLEIANEVNVTAASPLVLQPSLIGLTPVDNLGGKLTVRTAQVPAGTNCSQVTSYAPGLPKLPVLAKGTPQTVCVKVELAADTPASQLGKPINIPVTVSVAQTAPAK